jgi:adenosylcobyric acid synthase
VAPFENLDGVSVRFVTNPRDIEKADMVIIPGSKSTISDMIWLRESGMEAARKRLAINNPVVGICGGFQMMGDTIFDPDGIEGDVASVRGLGLLPIKTQMVGMKHRSQTEDCFDDMTGIYEALYGEEFIGYEIHNGTSEIDGDFSHLVERDDEGNIILVQKENIMGTYVHGIFDNGDIAYILAQELAKKKGVSLDKQASDYMSKKEMEYEKLADIVRNNLDMDFIYNLLK